MDVFKLSRQWFDWSFENPELIKPNHTALYFFIIEQRKRLGCTPAELLKMNYMSELKK